MNDKLIFDLGYYGGDSTLHYINEGYDIVGVDCNPQLEINRETEKYMKRGRLILERKCVSDTDNQNIVFYVQPNNIIWSSANKEIAERYDKSERHKVKTITLATLIGTYGTPIYCKIDIEGNEMLAIKSLSLIDDEKKPLYICCKTECVGKGRRSLNINGLENINALHELGYNKFFLKEQKDNYRFDINGKHEWKSYEEVIEELKKARSEHDFEQEPYMFLWDVYATF